MAPPPMAAPGTAHCLRLVPTAMVLQYFTLSQAAATAVLRTPVWLCSATRSMGQPLLVEVNVRARSSALRSMVRLFSHFIISAIATDRRLAGTYFCAEARFTARQVPVALLVAVQFSPSARMARHLQYSTV